MNNKFNLSKVGQSVDKGQVVASQPDQSLQQISSQFHDALRLNSFDQNSETKVCCYSLLVQSFLFSFYKFFYLDDPISSIWLSWFSCTFQELLLEANNGSYSK